jgi:peptide/nickel transport system permease protein
MLGKLILTRLALALLTLLAVSAFIFWSCEILPGDVAARVLGRYATPEAKQLFRTKLGLDRPAPERYAKWLFHAVQGDLGKAYANDTPVTQVVAPRLRNTLQLALFAFILYVPFSSIMAALAAVYRDRPVDHAISFMTLIGLSLPEFVVGTLLLLTFAVAIRAFPVMSLIDQAPTLGAKIRTLTLPAVTLAIAMGVYAIRMLRDSLIEVLNADYVRMATLKGMSTRRVVFSHALPNALIPALNVTALNLAYLIGGVVIVEQVFAYPGLGTLLVESVFRRDAPVIEASALIVSAIYILANLVADVLGVLLNPRLRTS